MPRGMPITVQQAQVIIDELREAGNPTAYARAKGVKRNTADSQIRTACDLLGMTREEAYGGNPEPKDEVKPARLIEHEVLEDPTIDAEALLDRLQADNERAIAHDKRRRMQAVKINAPGPIGICHYGDPHLDNAGTDIRTLRHCVEVVNSTDGMFASNLGDTHDNWVGRLSVLYRHSQVTETALGKLLEWFVNVHSDRWVFFLLGNHDLWSPAIGDPLRWISRQAGVKVETWDTCLRLSFPKGDPVTIRTAHSFKGDSIYHATHGQLRELRWGGLWADIYIAGHKHKSGYAVVVDPTSGIDGRPKRACHLIQVASFKIVDDYARVHGFQDENLSPYCVTVIDPEDTSVDRITVYHDIDVAAEYLTWLRHRRGYKARRSA